MLNLKRCSIKTFNKLNTSRKNLFNSNEATYFLNNLKCLSNAVSNENVRISEIGIQMLNEKLRSHLFGSQKDKDPETIKQVQENLKKFNLANKSTEILADVLNLKIPKLQGANIEEHFINIAKKQSDKYVNMITQLCNADIPTIPEKFSFTPGWTKYVGKDSTPVKIDFPEDHALVFDVEVLVSDHNFPTLAVAVGENAWYSWCGNRLIHDVFHHNLVLDELIPIGPLEGSNSVYSKERIVVCHNAGFDRSYVKEQYVLKKNKEVFLDTMSMHIACSGFTSVQRALSNSMKDKDKAELELSESKLGSKQTTNKNYKNNQSNTEWTEHGSLNNLHDVHKFYCPYSKRLEKEKRNIFVKGTMQDVRKDFQSLMNYCANDVKATYEILQKLLPLFMDRFKHPVTLSGMLEMGTMYLPVNENWLQYIENCDSAYEDMEHISRNALIKCANEACLYFDNKKYEKNFWLYDLDWNTVDLKMKKKANSQAKSKKEAAKPEKEEVKSSEDNLFKTFLNIKDSEKLDLSPETKEIMKTEVLLPKKIPEFCNYPKWYQELCEKPGEHSTNVGINLITAKLRITPKILKLTWNGYPLFHSTKYGWGYVVPENDAMFTGENASKDVQEKVGISKELENINNLIEKIEVQIQKESENSSDQDKLWKLVDKKTKYYEKVF